MRKSSSYHPQHLLVTNCEVSLRVLLFHVQSDSTWQPNPMLTDALKRPGERAGATSMTARFA
jgi:hypothetical protein